MCLVKDRNGICGHSQCPKPEESGYKCVDVVGGTCELSGECTVECKWNNPAVATESPYYEDGCLKGFPQAYCPAHGTLGQSADKLS
jgi:hypothetical protein